MPSHPQYPSYSFPQPPQRSQPLKLKFPTFDGGNNVLGYLSLFENMCNRSGVEEEDRTAKLQSCLKGTAQEWLMAQGEACAYLPYQVLRQMLMEHFQGQSATHVAALEELKCGDSVAVFNAAFTKKAAKAVSLLGEYGIKRMYLRQVRPIQLQPILSQSIDLPLQRLMAKAVEAHALLVPTLKKQVQSGPPNKDRTQNPNRKQCSTCKWWYDATKG